MDKIDFVIAWVDGADKLWLEEKNKYSQKKEDNSEVRFRDWDNLRYWFRGIEKYADWVNKIYFVTWGHYPSWLNLDNPKLVIVKHEDFIPKEYLPTFNSHTIELNLHRIKGLSEKFVYFNDDMFIISKVKSDFFFKNGIPRDTFGLNAICFGRDTAGCFNANDIGLINDNFSKKIQLKRNWKKWFSLRNGMKPLFRTVMLITWRWFPGLYYMHLPENYLKSTFENVWEKEHEMLDLTCRSRFRDTTNVNQWLFKYWQLVSGTFMPISHKRGKCFHVHDDISGLLNYILNQKGKLLCINDTAYTTDFEIKKNQVIEAFNTILPDKSMFEK